MIFCNTRMQLNTAYSDRMFNLFFRVPRRVEKQVTQWVRFQSELEQQEFKVHFPPPHQLLFCYPLYSVYQIVVWIYTTQPHTD
jgi:hypothetical protein